MIGLGGCCIFAPWFKRESLSHKTFRPRTDMVNSSVSHKWLHTKSQYLADNDGTKLGETRNRTGEYHDVGMCRTFSISQMSRVNFPFKWAKNQARLKFSEREESQRS